jgi:hypothetical protein
MASKQRRAHGVVMAGLVPAIHVFLQSQAKTWVPGPSPGMTSLWVPGETP